MSDVDFMRYELPDGGTRVDLTRLTDGQVMCCMCFDYFHRDGLNQIGPETWEDVCKGCAARESALEKGRQE